MDTYNRNRLEALLQQSVVELVFRRRHNKRGWPANRRMLCTTNRWMLNAVPGKFVFNFISPRGRLPYNPQEKNLVVGYDLLWQNFRAFGAEAVQVVAVFPLQTRKDYQNFWNMYQAKLAPMTAHDKTAFMKTN